MAIIESIAVNILSSLAYDLLKRTRGATIAAVDAAILRTAESFPGIEDLETALEQWLVSPEVISALEPFAKGLTGLDEIRIDVLAETFVKNTQFYLPDGAEATAQQIVSRFFSELREQYLKVPETGIPFVANLVEESDRRSEAGRQQVMAAIEGLKANPRHADSTITGSGFDARIDEANTHLQKYEYDLATHDCDKLRRHSWDALSARQKFRTLTILAAAHLCREELVDAARLFIEAKSFQPDDPTALANEARAHRLLDQSDRAFELAALAKDRFPDSSLALTVWLDVAPASVSMDDLERAVPPQFAEDVDILALLAYRALAAQEYSRSEDLARRAIKCKSGASWPWSLLGESLFRSALPGNPEDFSRLTVLADKKRLLEADEACTKAVEQAKIERRASAEVSALLIRAEVREALGQQSSAADDTIAAWALQPSDPTVIREYARLKLGRGEEQEAIRILRPVAQPGARDDLQMLLATALRRTSSTKDRKEASLIYETLATDSTPRDPRFRVYMLEAALGCFTEDESWEKARAVLRRVPAESISATARAVLEARLELAAGNREKSIELASLAVCSLTDKTSDDDVRRTATLLADLGRHRDALPLWRRLASPKQLGYDTSRFIDCTLRLGEDGEFLSMCEQLRSNYVYDKQLIEVETGVRSRYDIEATIGLLQEHLSRSPEDRNARLHLSAIGLELGRTELVVSAPDAMPAPEDVPHENWKLMVHVMKSGGHLTEALRFAYRVLRNNFGDPEAHRAYLACLLLPLGPRPDIPPVAVAGPGAAVAYREEGSTQEEWCVIEDEFEPNLNLQEIGPDHFISQQLIGKRVGDIFISAQGSVSSTMATVTQILNKYVFRFQDCTSKWQQRFPGLPDIQAVRAVKLSTGGEQEIDLTKLFASIDRIAADQEIAIETYRSQPVPVHLLACALNHNGFEQYFQVALDDSITVRCCDGNSKEHFGAIFAMRNASSVVLDLSAIATLALLDQFDELSKFNVQVLISELTLGEIRAYMKDQDGGSHKSSRIGKIEGRYFMEEVTPESRRQYRESLENVIVKLLAHCTITGCPELAAVPPEKRGFLTKAFGMHGAQSVVLATVPGRVLWTDDYGVAMLAQHEFGVRRVWTRVAFDERAIAGAIKPEVFHEATARLIGWRYQFTSPNLPALVCAGSLAQWNPDRWPLKQALDLLGDTNLSTKDAVRLAISLILHYAGEVVLPEVRGALTVQILANLSRRGQGLLPVHVLLRTLPSEFGLNLIRANEMVQLIRAWIASQPPMGLR